jgi:hypothetical protein
LEIFLKKKILNLKKNWKFEKQKNGKIGGKKKKYVGQT